MAVQTFNSVLITQQVAGTLFNTYTTAKTVIHPTALYTFAANSMYIGQVLRIRAMGGISNIVTTPGTITLQCMIGSAIAFTTGAIQLNATAHTVLPFTFEALLTVRALGNATNANLMGMAEVRGIMFTVTAGQVDGANTQTVMQVPQTAPAVGAGFDSTTAQILDFFAGFSINNAGNGIQIQQYVVEQLN